MMKKGLWLILCAVLCGMMSCAQVRDYAGIARNQVLSDEYNAALETWTREQTVYSHFETTLRIIATYRSPEFQNAYASECKRIYGEQDAGKDVLPKEICRDVLRSGFMEFFFYAATPHREENDFARTRSVWNVVLREEGSGLVHRPAEIREIEDINPVIMKFFPYVNRYYGKFYSVRYLFSSQDSESAAASDMPVNLTLIFSGVLGDAVLKWHSEVLE